MFLGKFFIRFEIKTWATPEYIGIATTSLSRRIFLSSVCINSISWGYLANFLPPELIGQTPNSPNLYDCFSEEVVIRVKKLSGSG